MVALYHNIVIAMERRPRKVQDQYSPGKQWKKLPFIDLS